MPANCSRAALSAVALLHHHGLLGPAATAAPAFLPVHARLSSRGWEKKQAALPQGQDGEEKKKEKEGEKEEETQTFAPVSVHLIDGEL